MVLSAIEQGKSFRYMLDKAKRDEENQRAQLCTVEFSRFKFCFLVAFFESLHSSTCLRWLASREVYRTLSIFKFVRFVSLIHFQNHLNIFHVFLICLSISSELLITGVFNVDQVGLGISMVCVWNRFSASMDRHWQQPDWRLKLAFLFSLKSPASLASMSVNQTIPEPS